MQGLQDFWQSVDHEGFVVHDLPPSAANCPRFVVDGYEAVIYYYTGADAEPGTRGGLQVAGSNPSAGAFFFVEQGPLLVEIWNSPQLSRNSPGGLFGSLATPRNWKLRLIPAAPRLGPGSWVSRGSLCAPGCKRLPTFCGGCAPCPAPSPWSPRRRV